MKRLLAAATLTILLSPSFLVLASSDLKSDQDVEYKEDKDKRDWKKDHKYKERRSWHRRNVGGKDYKDDDDKDRADGGRTKDSDKDHKYEDDEDRDKGGDYHKWSGKLQTAADEMTSLGLVSAMAIGAAGYLILRRRTLSASSR